ncbi:hypothetical protein Zmor_001263 [Zophobas morio]|uniref:Secreted protein n=1 Tax=Zophobas morio TaxID=2755281 RepID=A0AA38J8J9_9CUCU|nr:hypothetical protein Zmor_001263 [Zophobas morio]
MNPIYCSKSVFSAVLFYYLVFAGAHHLKSVSPDRRCHPRRHEGRRISLGRPDVFVYISGTSRPKAATTRYRRDSGPSPFHRNFVAPVVKRTNDVVHKIRQGPKTKMKTVQLGRLMNYDSDTIDIVTVFR